MQVAPRERTNEVEEITTVKPLRLQHGGWQREEEGTGVTGEEKP